jgi:hypothetical protein
MLHLADIVFKSSLFVLVSSETISYRARILPLSNVSDTPTHGIVTIFTDASSSLIGYAGIVKQVEPNLLASTCNATNGCGVHIHSGRSCYNSSLQGGHYFNSVSTPVDPWIDERYSSDVTGKANFQSIIQIGSVDIEGRAFVGTFTSVEVSEKFQLNIFTLLIFVATCNFFIYSALHEWHQNRLWNY